jgi:hypothetical protein
MPLEMRSLKRPTVAPQRCVVEAWPSKKGTRAVDNRPPLVSYSMPAIGVYPPKLQAKISERENLLR